jgi:hypothetical protein
MSLLLGLVLSGCVAAIFTGIIREVWFTKESKDPSTSVTPFTNPENWSNGFLIAAGVGTIAGLALTMGSPFQQAVYTAESVPQVISTLQSSLGAGKTLSANVPEIVNNVFVKPQADGTTQVIYFKKTSDGSYAVRTLSLNKGGVYVGPNGPTSVGFLMIEDGKIKINPQAEQELEKQNEALLLAQSSGLSATDKAAAINLAAASGHGVAAVPQ